MKSKTHKSESQERELESAKTDLVKAMKILANEKKFEKLLLAIDNLRTEMLGSQLGITPARRSSRWDVGEDDIEADVVKGSDSDSD